MGSGTKGFDPSPRQNIHYKKSGLGALLDKMEDNDQIKLDNRDLDVCFTLRPAVFEIQIFFEIGIH